MPFGFTHPTLVILSKSAITSFFRRIEVYGTENVPDEGPIIFACTHSNMAVDPAVLSNAIPSKYYLHYWAKDSLFKNPVVGALLRNSGNIAVDRKNKNNQLLFKGTFEALQQGECIGVFPEGTSHTEPHMIPPKDGTSWAALEYLRYLEGTPENGGKKQGRKAVVVPVALCYTDKSKFRSRLVAYLCEPITMDSFEEQFMSTGEGQSRLAVKRLTRTIESALWRRTVNAPDWDTAYAAQMARELLWETEDDLKLSDFVDVSQTLVDLFTTPHPGIQALKTLLVTYHRLLLSSRLSNAALVDLPLPRTLNPSESISLPSRFTALYLFIRDTIIALVLLPFFAVPMIMHLPIYCAAVFAGRLAEEEMETQAQMKIGVGLLLSLLMYPVAFLGLWLLGGIGGALGLGVAGLGVWVVRRYHTALVDYNYDSFKRLAAAWRLLIGLWLPPQFDLPLPSFLSRATAYAPDPPKVAGLPPQTPPEKYVRPQHVPSRVLVKHVLRTRLEAARELASVLSDLEKGDEGVQASFWLASTYGGEQDRKAEALERWEDSMPGPKGYRRGPEVVRFLRERGARVGRVVGGQEGHWAADGAGETGH